MLKKSSLNTMSASAIKNWFRTGGPARFFAEPTAHEEFQATLAWARTEKVPVFVLGCGANILISDTGFNGLVIRPQLNTIEYLQHPRNIDNEHVLLKAGAGVTIAQLISYSLEQNLLGLEEFSGIPATVGGAVFINLHYYEFALSHFIASAEIIEKETGAIKTVDADWLQLGYDQSKLFDGQHYILSATFKLRRCTDLEAACAQGRRAEIIRHRVKRYPSTNT
ncbi:FAD-binding protein, partial [Methylicorpusculum sp.]|uniref:FAD-binding protein n=1 Tax=Methylicorpusculum sp. TaxID=2713644 RepID=UPI002ABCF08B